jgi:hypothetical protein
VPASHALGVVSTPLVALNVIAVSIWVGSLVAIAVFARVSRRVLDDRSRVALFAGVGRAYAVVGPVALLVALGTGLALAGHPASWSGHVTAAVAGGAALVAVSVVAMAHAHRMTTLRRRLVAAPGDSRLAAVVRRDARIAGGLRGGLALLTLVVLVLGSAAVAVH